MKTCTDNKYIKSPMNYIGGKYRLLGQILPLFPNDINCFVDLFAGGCNVGINISANKIICNDIVPYIIELYEYFTATPIDTLLHQIEQTISYYSLSLTNEIGYKQLRQDYNDSKQPLLLFILICYSFNHQIRYNNSQLFTTPFGKERSRYNDTIKYNLIKFTSALKEKNIEFHKHNFKHFDYTFLTPRDFVYCDPPYLITTGPYNDGRRGFEGWGVNEEIQLLSLLDELDSRKVRFALSNVITHNEKENLLLIDWLNTHKYNVNYLSMDYSNSYYRSSDKRRPSKEVLITNY